MCFFLSWKGVVYFVFLFIFKSINQFILCWVCLLFTSILRHKLRYPTLLQKTKDLWGTCSVFAFAG